MDYDTMKNLQYVNLDNFYSSCMKDIKDYKGCSYMLSGIFCDKIIRVEYFDHIIDKSYYEIYLDNILMVRNEYTFPIWDKNGNEKQHGLEHFSFVIKNIIKVLLKPLLTT